MPFETPSFQLSLAQSHQAIFALKPEWEELHQRCSCPTIYNSFDFVFTSIKHFSVATDELFFICLRAQTDQSLVAIFPFSLSDYYWRMGKFRSILLAGREESDKAYPIIEKHLEAVVWPEVLRFLTEHKKRWQFLDFEEVRENSAAQQALEKQFKSGYLVHSNADAVSPIIDLSQSWDEFWAEHRKMRKRVRKIESVFADEFKFEVVSEQHLLMQALEDYIELEKRSWKSKAKVGIGKSPTTIAFYREYFEILAENNQLEFAFLSKADELVSAEIAYTFGSTVYFSHGCYSSSFKSLSPGMVSTCLFLKHYFGKNYQDGDFLGGFAQYINPWASQLMPSSNLIVIRIGFKTVLFYLLDLLRRLLFKPIKVRLANWMGRSKERQKN